MTDTHAITDQPAPVHPPLGSGPAALDPRLSDWCASIGRITADVLALMFLLPAPPHVVALFEAEMRGEVGAEMDALGMPDDLRRHLMDVAWVAFDRRLSLHRSALPYGGRA